MKNIKFKLIGVLILVALVVGSCKKWINTDINTSPDSPIDVPMSSLLPAVEANLAYNTIGGNDYTRVTTQWIQQFMGIARQSQGESNYIWHDGDVDNVWNTTYAFSMTDLKTLISKSTDDPTYRGIADVLLADALGHTTDIWGDIPYSQAFQGVNNLSPSFDTQDTVYNYIYKLLDEAIAKLASTTTVVRGDLIYNGDPALWLKAANAMKARYLLHLSKQDPGSYAKALAALSGCLASNADNMQLVFLNQQGSQNPLYQFMNQRGDIAMHQVFMDTLKGRGPDPRMYVYASPGADTSDLYQGAGWGSTGENASPPGPAVASPAAPVYFITYAECLFIKTECEFATGVAESQVKADLVAAVGASMDQFGVYDATYMTFYDAAIQQPYVTGPVLFHEIMMQKWIALYNQGEAYVDWRRTENAIGLSPNPNPATGSKPGIPRRFPYSLGEKSYNSNTPTDVDIWQRVWWDKAPK
ncbi:MAG TPA: SusD/RagB family nutrient-binding outer membrane lipoprotein [Bacteroidales bacterium]|nr:SusD/RagB family nutrient-binding outer membrane lipoprotein [Bacteroidales bacterium]